jgi:quercetin dioxygenase-like cupin family protein
MFSVLAMTTVLRGAQAPQFNLPGVTFRAAAAPSRGSTEVCMWRLTVAPHHRADAGHRLDRDEIFMVLSGELVLSPGGPVLKAGDVAVVPAGELIAAGNPSGGTDRGRGGHLGRIHGHHGGRQRHRHPAVGRLAKALGG